MFRKRRTIRTSRMRKRGRLCKSQQPHPNHRQNIDKPHRFTRVKGGRTSLDLPDYSPFQHSRSAADWRSSPMRIDTPPATEADRDLSRCCFRRQSTEQRVSLACMAGEISNQEGEDHPLHRKCKKERSSRVHRAILPLPPSRMG